MPQPRRENPMTKTGWLVICLIALCGTAIGRSKDINLTVTNPTETTLDVSVVIKNKKKIVKQEIQLGTLNQNGQITRRFKVDVDGEFTVNAFLHNSAQVFDETKTVLKSDPSPLATTTTLSIKYGNLLKIETAQTVLK